MTEIIQRGFQEDSLVCGSCQRNFPFGNFTNFVQHKQFDCEKFTSDMIEALACQSCPAEFGTPWSLLMHAQNVHALKIYFERTSERFGNRREAEKIENCYVKTASFRNIGKQTKTIDSYATENVVELNEYSPQTVTEQVMDRAESTASDKRVRFERRIESKRSEVRETLNEKTLTSNEAGRARIEIDVQKDDGDSNKSLSGQTPELSNQRPSDSTLKKCCSSVVPKKRKRHMETKHMIGGISSGSAKGRRRIGSSEGPTSIFIDFEPQDEFSSKCNDVQYDLSYSADSEDFKGNGQHGIERCQESRFYQPLKQHSVIIQPGMMFSIPVSYNMEPSVSIYNSSESSSSMFPKPLRTGLLEDREGRRGERSSHTGGRTSSLADDRKNEEESDPYEEKCGSGQQLSPQPSATEISEQSGKESLFRSAQGSDNQGQKKRRYPTSRPFKCDQCEDSFNQRIHLQKHQSKHTGVKPFKCDRCDYSTVERSHLKVHIRVHTGEKPYKCTYCGYATAQNSTLKIHLKRHHLTNEELNSFICGTCGMHFNQREIFDSHSVQEHNQRICVGSNEETTSCGITFNPSTCNVKTVENNPE